jgi:hypothetical protein
MNILQKTWNRIRFGTVFQWLHRRLAKIGIDIFPYYWVLEGKDPISPPEFHGNLEEYTFEFFGSQEMKEIGETADLKGLEKPLLARLEKGNKCYGVKHLGRIVGYTWMDIQKSTYRGNEFLLGDHEAYLFDMYTKRSYRGKNIAPYLRYKCYKALNKMGRDTFYSVSEFYNPPSIKFKKKLNAEFVKLGLHISLFKKLRWHFILRKYKK